MLGVGVSRPWDLFRDVGSDRYEVAVVLVAALFGARSAGEKRGEAVSVVNAVGLVPGLGLAACPVVVLLVSQRF